MATAVVLRGCSRCGGDLFDDPMERGQRTCIQCGRSVNRSGLPALVPAPLHQPEVTLRSLQTQAAYNSIAYLHFALGWVVDSIVSALSCSERTAYRAIQHSGVERRAQVQRAVARSEERRHHG